MALLGFITENRKSSFGGGDIKLANSNDEKCHGCFYRSKFLYYAFCTSKTHMTALQNPTSHSQCLFAGLLFSFNVSNRDWNLVLVPG